MTTDDLGPEPADLPPRRSDRTLWYLIGGLVVIWFGYLALFGPRGGTGSLAPPTLREPALGQADYSWALETLDGQPVELSQYRGRPIVLNVWATWCPPCLMEMPSLRNLARQPGLDSVAFLAVSTEEAPVLQRFAAAENSPLTILRSPDLPPPVFLTDGIPATFLIAPDGRIVAAHVGAAQWDDPSVVDLLTQLSASARPAAAGTAAVGLRP